MRYTTVSSSYVDDTLFSKGFKKTAVEGRPPSHGGSSVPTEVLAETKQLLASPLPTTVGNPPPGAAAAGGGGGYASNPPSASHAQARKDRILALERAKLAQPQKSALEIETEQEAHRLRALLAAQRDTSLADAKYMSGMVDYAHVVRARDQQLAEKAAAAAVQAAQERVRHDTSEQERLHALRLVAEREAEAREATRRVACSIRGQVEERSKLRAAEVESTRKEGKEAAARMAANAEGLREARAAERRRQAAQLAAVLQANEESIALRTAQREAAAEEDKLLARLQIEMDLKRAAEDAEREVIHRAREAAAFKVRGQVEKLLDNRGALDEARARRAFEAGQRVQRERDAERGAKEQAVRASLRASREQLLAAKQQRLAVDIELDKAEFERAALVQRAWLEAERQKTDALLERSRQMSQALLEQKEAAGAAARAAAAQVLAEGEAERRAAAAQTERLRQIRDDKVAALRSEGYTPPSSLVGYNPAKAVESDYKLGPKKADRARTSSGGSGKAASAAGAASNGKK